jgi:cysteine desulfurase
MQNPIYLDNASTTQIFPEVLHEMLPYLTDVYGNASSSTHAFGWKAKGCVNWANSVLSEILNCDISEIVYTSGATESINTVLLGVFNAYQLKGKHFVVAQTEHKAVLDVMQYLQNLGAEVTFLAVQKDGLIDLNVLQNHIRKDTVAVVVMWVNNETGVVQDIAAIADLVYCHQSILICDATQAIGKISIDFKALPIGVLIGSAHKFHGPKGVGFHLIKRKQPRVSVSPLILGGAQQNGRRSGTLNVAGIVGLAKALQCCRTKDFVEVQHLGALLQQKLLDLGCSLNGSSHHKIPHIINVQSNIKTHDLIKLTPQLAYSLGSACNSDNQQASHVLLAMGLNSDQAFKSFRLSLSALTTIEEVKTIINIFENIFKNEK